MTLPSVILQLSSALDIMCPMHVMVDRLGKIQHVGPTIRKLRPRKTLEGCLFLDVFELLRPRKLTTVHQLLASHGSRLHLRFRDAPMTGLQGVVVDSPEMGGAIINLSFGISVLDAVRDYDLNSVDFAPTDLAIEMLYLVEAKSAAMEASRKLNQRLQGAMIAAEEQAFTDTLTGLKNRRAVEHVMPRLFEAEKGFAIMQMDLDFFKAVNDTHGHAAGDYVLQQVARILVEETREQDCVARIGGDEFVLIFPGMRSRKALSAAARRIIDRIEQPIPYEGQPCKVSASIGIALWQSQSGDTTDALLANADAALYACKNRGRACYSFFEDLLGDEISCPLRGAS